MPLATKALASRAFYAGISQTHGRIAAKAHVPLLHVNTIALHPGSLSTGADMRVESVPVGMAPCDVVLGSDESLNGSGNELLWHRRTYPVRLGRIAPTPVPTSEGGSRRSSGVMGGHRWTGSARYRAAIDTMMDVKMADTLSTISATRQNPHRDRLGSRHMRLQCVVP